MVRTTVGTLALVALGINGVLAVLIWFGLRALLTMTWTLNRGLVAGWILCLVAVPISFTVQHYRRRRRSKIQGPIAVGGGVVVAYLKQNALLVTAVFFVLFVVSNVARRLL